VFESEQSLSLLRVVETIELRTARAVVALYNMPFLSFARNWHEWNEKTATDLKERARGVPIRGLFPRSPAPAW
jgi:hypothetical protein